MGEEHTLDGRVSDVGHGDGVEEARTRERGRMKAGRGGWRGGRRIKGRAEEPSQRRRSSAQVGGNEEIHEIHDCRTLAVFFNPARFGGFILFFIFHFSCPPSSPYSSGGMTGREETFCCTTGLFRGPACWASSSQEGVEDPNHNTRITYEYDVIPGLPERAALPPHAEREAFSSRKSPTQCDPVPGHYDAVLVASVNSAQLLGLLLVTVHSQSPPLVSARPAGGPFRPEIDYIYSSSPPSRRRPGLELR